MLPIQSLDLKSHTFPSLSALIRLVSSLPHLVYLKLWDVHWPQSPPYTQFLWRMSIPREALWFTAVNIPQVSELLIASLLGLSDPARSQHNHPEADIRAMNEVFSWLDENDKVHLSHGRTYPFGYYSFG